MNCGRFAGPDEKKRIQDIFRYIDRNGNGQVSVGEFGFLEVLSKEVQMTLREFIDFLGRRFGEHLEDSWAWFDERGTGEVTAEAMCKRAREAGYFGPSRPIFRYLDKDEVTDKRGTISFQEFKQLDIVRRRTTRILHGCS